jgi:hypothetical protein
MRLISEANIEIYFNTFVIMRDITKKVEQTIAKLTRTVTIDLITDNGNGTYQLDSCCTYWLRPCKTITIDAVDYKIQSFVQNESLTVKGDVLPTATSFTITPPFYKHGTPTATNSELFHVDNDQELPLAWLLEILTQSVFQKEDNPLDYSSDLRLFFLDGYDPEDGLTSDLYTDIIRPMQSMVEEFIKEVELDGNYNDVDEYRTINWSKFGVYTTNQGSTSQVLDAYLTGIELRITLEIMKKVDCNDCSC